MNYCRKTISEINDLHQPETALNIDNTTQRIAHVRLAKFGGQTCGVERIRHLLQNRKSSAHTNVNIMSMPNIMVSCQCYRANHNGINMVLFQMVTTCSAICNKDDELLMKSRLRVA